MSALAISCIVFACIFGGALAAMFIRQALPEHHLSADSKDIVKMGMGVIATLAALVLGLLIATAKGTYDTQNSAVKDLSTDILQLDRVLAMYGSDTKEARDLLRSAVENTLDSIWPEGGARPGSLTPGAAKAAGEAMYQKIADLSPQNDAQRAFKARALDITNELLKERLGLYARKDASLPVPFLVVMVFWLTILFAGYGLLAPRNGTVVVVLLVCALSISGAVFLILELTTPFAGIMHISSGPMRDALALLGK
jgi:hypothetical protein